MLWTASTAASASNHHNAGERGWRRTPSTQGTMPSSSAANPSTPNSAITCRIRLWALSVKPRSPTPASSRKLCHPNCRNPTPSVGALRNMSQALWKMAGRCSIAKVWARRPEAVTGTVSAEGWSAATSSGTRYRPSQREHRHQQQPAIHRAALGRVETAGQQAEQRQKHPGGARPGERQDVQAESTRAHGVHQTQSPGCIQVSERGQPERHVVGEVIRLRQVAPHPRLRGDGDVASQERVAAQMLSETDHAACDQPGEQVPGEHRGDTLKPQLPTEERREDHQRARPQQVQGSQPGALLEHEPAQHDLEQQQHDKTGRQEGRARNRQPCGPGRQRQQRDQSQRHRHSFRVKARDRQRFERHEEGQQPHESDHEQGSMQRLAGTGQLQHAAGTRRGHGRLGI